jgi:hypothetical protein
VKTTLVSRKKDTRVTTNETILAPDRRAIVRAEETTKIF